MVNPAERWSWEKVIGAFAALLTVLSLLSGAIWTYAGVSYATQTIPGIKQQQDANTKDIAVLQEARRNSNQQYAEILVQLARLNDKFDRLNEGKK